MNELEGYPCMDAFLFLHKCGLNIKGYYNSDHVVGLIKREDGDSILVDEDGIIEDWGHSQTKEELYLPNQSKFIPFSSYGKRHLVMAFSNLSEKDKKILGDCC